MRTMKKEGLLKRLKVCAKEYARIGYVDEANKIKGLIDSLEEELFLKPVEASAPVLSSEPEEAPKESPQE